MFKINSKKSKIEFYPINNEKSQYILEYPQMNNKSIIKQLANNNNMQYIMNNSEDIQIVLLLNAPDFDVERGAPMIEYMTSFLRAFFPIIQTKD